MPNTLNNTSHNFSNIYIYMYIYIYICLNCIKFKRSESLEMHKTSRQLEIDHGDDIFNATENVTEK